MNTSNNHFIPVALDTSELQDQIVLLQYIRIGNRQVSVIERHNKILDALYAGDKPLYPFKDWKLTKAGNIQFSSLDKVEGKVIEYSSAKSATKHQLASNINPAAMNHIHGYRDVRSAQANDMEAPEDGEF